MGLTLQEKHNTHRVTACKAENGYRLWLRFEDGVEGSVFLGNLLEIGAFQLWRDVREFAKVSVDSRRQIWEGASMDPDVLHQGVLMEHREL